MRVADVVVEELSRAGTQTVFTVSGGGSMFLNHALAQSENVQYVCNLHEQASAIAAEAYAKMRNSVGACMVTTGPGSTNTLTGLVGAWLDSTPVIFIAGQVKRQDSARLRRVRTFGVQEVDMISIINSVTKLAITLDDPTTAREKLRNAIQVSQNGRPGPVWIEVPLDIQSAEVPPTMSDSTTFDAENEEIQHNIELEDLLNFEKIIANAKRPLILIGNGVRLSKSVLKVLKLADIWKSPILLTWLAIDLLTQEDVRFLGRPGVVAPRSANFAIQSCDVLVVLGARLDQVVTANDTRNFARKATKIIVDIDENELRKHDLPESHLVLADIKDFVESMLNLCEGKNYDAHENWWTRCLDWKNRYPIQKPLSETNPERISIYSFADKISEKLSGNETIISGSSGSGIEIFLHALKVKQGQRILHTTALGSMGFCLPTIIGAWCADPSRNIIAVDGDGGFFFNIQELETIKRLNIPVKIFVLNNNGFSSIRNSQQHWFGDDYRMGADASSQNSLPDISRVSESFGIQNMRISDYSELDAGVSQALSQKGPLVIEVMAIENEAREPRVTSRLTEDGHFESLPLEDLYPLLPREILESELRMDS